MQWTDDAIVIGTRPHGESSLLVQLLTRGHGRHAGIARGGRSAKQRAAFQLGNRVQATWRARLDEHLGNWDVELVRGDVAVILDDGDRLGCLAAAAALAETALAEREPVERVYEGFAELMDALAAEGPWPARYVAWELELLAELGFGLDLTRCAVTRSTEDLAYVSPRTARAVSAVAGAPYAEKLLPLPRFLLLADPPAAAPDPVELVRALDLAGYFLARHAFAPQGQAEPAARTRFVDRMRQKAHNR